METFYELELLIQQNPKNSQYISQVIDVLQDIVDSADVSIDEVSRNLAKYRTFYVDKYLPNKLFLESWLTDLRCSSKKDDTLVGASVVVKAYRLAITLCPHVDIITDYLDYILDLYNRNDVDDDDDDDNDGDGDGDDDGVGVTLSFENMIKHFEYAVSICGIDVYDGNRVWKMYREFLVTEHDCIVDQSNEVDDVNTTNGNTYTDITSLIRKSKERIVNVYLRQLSLPIAENDVCLVELEHVLERICVPSDVDIIKPQLLQERYLSSNKQCQDRVVWEDELISKYIGSRRCTSIDMQQACKYLKEYIMYEIHDNRVLRAQRLYERCLSQTYVMSLDMWLEYVEFSFYLLKDMPLVENITNRVIKLINTIHPSSLLATLSANYSHFITTVWTLRLISIEATATLKVDVTDASLIDDAIKEAVYSAIQYGAGSSSYDAFLRILTYQCDYHKRQLVKLLKSPQHDERVYTNRISLLRQSFEDCLLYISTYYPTWDAGYLYICRHRVTAEDQEVGDAISIMSDSSCIAQNLSEKAWERALELYSTSYCIWVEYIAWVSVERRADKELRRQLYKKALSLVGAEYSQELSLKWLQFENQCGDDIKHLTYAMNRTKQYISIPLPVVVAVAPTATDSAAATDSTATATSNNRKRKGGDDGSRHEEDNKKVKHAIDTTAPTESASASAPKKPKAVHDPHTIFITKFPPQMTAEQLRAAFSRYGEVAKVHMIKDKVTGECKGQALLQYVNETDRKSALQCNKLQVDDVLFTVLPSLFSASLVKASASVADVSTDTTSVVADANASGNDSVGQRAKQTSALAFKPRAMRINLRAKD